MFQRYQRSEQVLVLAMIEMVINGVSTRKIENITQELCGGSFSKSTVSKLCEHLEPSVDAFRNRPLDEVEKYEDRHYVRLSITSGITGNWQVNGRSDVVDFEKIVEMDTEYIMNWTIWKDIRIMIKTIGILFKRKGAY